MQSPVFALSGQRLSLVRFAETCSHLATFFFLSFFPLHFFLLLEISDSLCTIFSSFTGDPGLL